MLGLVFCKCRILILYIYIFIYICAIHCWTNPTSLFDTFFGKAFLTIGFLVILIPLFVLWECYF